MKVRVLIRAHVGGRLPPLIEKREELYRGTFPRNNFPNPF